ncbi:MAG: GNAT family N-acetyltransferase [Lachnospiraceae bacterium]|jgi:RimJ/RimL family protein N-acetyltransferase|nr:GNAT family N-acetyltransferase [Lachnospiraceae bacterium]
MYKGTVSIRKWRMEDAPDIAAVLNNKSILDNLRDGIPFPYTERDGAQYIESMLSADPEGTFAFAIAMDDRAVGSVGVFRQANIHSRSAEMGYYVGQEHWGQGVCTEAVKQACRHVFENSDILRIYAEPFAHNGASCRVLEKAGFTYEGTLRSNAVKNGAVLDMKVYALVRGNPIAG